MAGETYQDPLEMGDLIYRCVEGLNWVMHRGEMVYSHRYALIPGLYRQFWILVLLILTITDLRGCLLTFSSERVPAASGRVARC